MQFRPSYHLAGTFLSLDVGYLLIAALVPCSCCSSAAQPHNVIGKIKSTLEGTNSRITEAEDRTSEVEYR